MNAKWPFKSYHQYIIFIFYGIFTFRILTFNSLTMHPDLTLFGVIAERVLSGEIFLRDFFEVSPYPVFLFYLPVAILSKVVGLELFLSMGIYLWLIYTFVLYLFYKHGYMIFKEKNSYLFFIFQMFLIIVVPEIGQREILFGSFLLTYILILWSHKISSEKDNIFFNYILFIFLALGSLFKPQFILVFIIVRLYYYFFIGKKSFLMENFLYVLVLLINIFYLNYMEVPNLPFYLEQLKYHVDGPYSKFFWSGRYYFWELVVISSMLSLIIYIYSFKVENNKNLLRTFSMITMLGVVIGLAQNKAWIYHIYFSVLFSLMGLSILMLNSARLKLSEKYLGNLIISFFLAYFSYAFFMTQKNIKKYHFDIIKTEFDLFFNNPIIKGKKLKGMFFTEHPFFMNYQIQNKLVNLNTFLWMHPLPILKSETKASDYYHEEVSKIIQKDFQKSPDFIIVSKLCIHCEKYHGIFEYFYENHFKDIGKNYKIFISQPRYNFYLKNEYFNP